MNRDPIANRVANPDAIKSGSRIRLIFFTIKKIPVRRKNLIKRRSILFFSLNSSVAEPPLFWAAPEVRGPGADSGSD